MKTSASQTNLIGQRLKSEMKKRGVSSARLAMNAGVKTSFIYDIISGKSANPSTVKLARVADSLGISLKSLVDAGLAAHEAGIMPLAANAGFVTIPRLVVDTAREETTVISVHREDEPFCFRRDWLRQRLNLPPEGLRLFSVSGDSMAPSLCPGDILLVDVSATHPSPAGLFIVYDGYGLSPKRLELLAQQDAEPRVRAISDNPQYSIYEKSLGDMRIIGRVVWFGRGI